MELVALNGCLVHLLPGACGFQWKSCQIFLNNARHAELSFHSNYGFSLTRVGNHCVASTRMATQLLSGDYGVRVKNMLAVDFLVRNAI